MSKPVILLSVVGIVTIVLMLWLCKSASVTDTLTPVGFFGPFKRKKKASSVKVISKLPPANDGARKPTSSVKGLVRKIPNPGDGQRKCTSCHCQIEDKALRKMTGDVIMGVPLSEVFRTTPSSCYCKNCD